MLFSHECCISYHFYIKPQLRVIRIPAPGVVYLIISTSNHNVAGFVLVKLRLYILSFLHQTTTGAQCLCAGTLLYILSFLHQNHNYGTSNVGADLVVYLIISTSNHNLAYSLIKRAAVVYLIISTSNHNIMGIYHILPMLYILSFLHQTTT